MPLNLTVSSFFRDLPQISFDTQQIMMLAGAVGFVLCLGLIVALVLKSGKIGQLQTSVNNLRKALDEMDEQAKLIVRTDIELNRAQEELDKKLTGLYTLQALSRSISSTLEENQIFTKIGAQQLEALGFDRAMAVQWDDVQKRFSEQLSLGFADEEVNSVRLLLENERDFFLGLINGDRTCSSISPLEEPRRDRIRKTFGAFAFVFSPILPKEGDKGLLFVGTRKRDTVITQGDEELINILASQVGQGLENARLFDKTWQAHQELEKRVEERTRDLNLALQEVKTISKRKSDFVSSVSHELRTPLTSIKGYASILLAGKLGATPPEVQKRLEKINKHSDELVQFVNDLLDIARIESGRMTMKIQALDLKTVVEEVSDVLTVLMKEKGIEYVWETDPDVPEVLADKDQVKRVFINLINNAIKYTPNGKIAVKVHRAGSEVQVDIADTGCGIPETALPRIFEEFYRVDSTLNQEIKGTGLGLSLVKNIIEAHKGRIWVKSRVGEGSTFNFTLPFAAPA